MKRIILAVIGGTVLICTGFYLSRSALRFDHSSAPLTETHSSPVRVDTEASTAQDIAPEAQQASALTQTSAAARSVSPRASAQPKPSTDGVPLSQTVDALVSTQATYQQKQEAWKQLRESGKLDEAITDLEQRMTNNPGVADYPAALGQAYLKKCAVIKDVREQGILAMQADKLFDTALNLDSSNWEARFTKAVALSYWPTFLNKGDEVIQHFQTLIEQQETQTPQPQFAEAYAWLGDQYQRAGHSEDARAIWQRGASLFPTDEKLRSKLEAEQ